MNDPLSSLPGYALRRAANATAAELAGRLAPLGLRQSDVSLMMLVEANPGATASALGRELDIQRANMVPLLNRMERAGWIERAPIDRKSQGLALTAAGRAKLGEGRRVIEQFERDLIARVPPEHRAHLLPALNALWR
jgi:DNA-binding MarR family transcriptional regulator